MQPLVKFINENIALLSLALVGFLALYVAISFKLINIRTKSDISSNLVLAERDRQLRCLELYARGMNKSKSPAFVKDFVPVILDLDSAGDGCLLSCYRDPADTINYWNTAIEEVKNCPLAKGFEQDVIVLSEVSADTPVSIIVKRVAAKAEAGGPLIECSFGHMPVYLSKYLALQKGGVSKVSRHHPKLKDYAIGQCRLVLHAADYDGSLLLRREPIPGSKTQLTTAVNDLIPNITWAEAKGGTSTLEFALRWLVHEHFNLEARQDVRLSDSVSWMGSYLDKQANELVLMGIMLMDSRPLPDCFSSFLKVASETDSLETLLKAGYEGDERFSILTRLVLDCQFRFSQSKKGRVRKQGRASHFTDDLTFVNEPQSPKQTSYS